MTVVMTVEDLRDSGLVGVADHPGHTGQAAEFLGGSLGVTAGDEDAGPWILAADAINRLPDVGVSLGGDRARIQNHKVGIAGR